MKENLFRPWLFSIAIAICPMFSYVGAANAQGKRVALVIGNSTYSQRPLKNTVNDAADMAAALRRLGFEVLERKNRSSDELRRDLVDFQDKLSSGSVGLFYYAGHGVQAGRGLNFLLPVGVDYRRERDAEIYGLEVGSVLRRMEESGTSLNLVILDACRDSPLPAEGRSTSGRGLGRMEAPSGSMIAFSTAPGSTADDNTTGRNGLYTHHLLAALDTPGLRLEDLFKRVRRGVESDSGRRQSPEEISKLTSDEPFYFRPGPSVAAIRLDPTPAGPRPAQNGAVSLDDLEREDATRKQWAQWLERMRGEYAKTAAFSGAPDLAVKAWDRFLVVWSQDNPNSREDEDLRAQASNRREQALQQAAAPALAPSFQVAIARPSLQPDGVPGKIGGASVVRIGSAGPLSGAQAHYGKDNLNGVRMAVDELNARGLSIGGRRVTFEVVAEDDKADPREGTMAARRFCDLQVSGVVGHLNSGTSIPASSIYNQCGIPAITPSATNPKLTLQGFRTAFRLLANDNAVGVGMAIFAARNAGARRVAIIDDRTAYGQGVADAFKSAALAQGLQVVDQQYTNDKATDFTNILTAIKSKAPEVIFFGGMDTQAGPMLRQIEQLGLGGVKFLGGDGMCTSQLVQLAGGSRALANAHCAEGGASLDRMPGGRAWKARYDARFPNEFQVYSPYAYDAVHVLVDAMVRAGSSDPKLYASKLFETNLQGVTARLRFDRSGEILDGPLTYYGYRDGRKVTLN